MTTNEKSSTNNGGEAILAIGGPTAPLIPAMSAATVSNNANGTESDGFLQTETIGMGFTTRR